MDKIDIAVLGYRTALREVDSWDFMGKQAGVYQVVLSKMDTWKLHPQLEYL